MLRWNGWNDRHHRKVRFTHGDRGSASLELITAGTILLVPLVYLVITMSTLQAGALAVEGAARQAARVYVSAADEADASVRAERAVQFSLADHGMTDNAASVQVDCEGRQNGCLIRGGLVTVTVRLVVPLPLVPAMLEMRNTAGVPLAASATQTVSRFWGAE